MSVPNLKFLSSPVTGTRKAHTHNTQPFYGSVEFVRENPGEPVPEETFTHERQLYKI